MIILDTNVISEFMKPEPEQNVRYWLNQFDGVQLFTTAISWSELHIGIAILPEGKRKEKLSHTLSQQIYPMFKGRILNYGHHTSEFHARIASQMRTKGKQADFTDCAIAAIAMQHSYTIATRNTEDFLHTGVALINPWEAH